MVSEHLCICTRLTIFVFCFHFSQVDLRSKNFPVHAKSYLSQILICVKQFPISNPSTWQVLHIEMLIKQHHYCTGVLWVSHNKRPLKNVHLQVVTGFEVPCNWQFWLHVTRAAACGFNINLNTISPFSLQAIWQHIQHPPKTADYTDQHAVQDIHICMIIQPPGKFWSNCGTHSQGSSSTCSSSSPGSWMS